MTDKEMIILKSCLRYIHQEALNSINKLDPKSLSYQECPMTHIRSTYEVVKQNEQDTRTKIV